MNAPAVVDSVDSMVLTLLRYAGLATSSICANFDTAARMLRICAWHVRHTRQNG
jgi:hypothetical protein